MQQNQTYKIARVVADQIVVNNSTTQTNITKLLHALKGDSKVHKFVLTLLVTGKAAADIDVSITGPAGSTLTYGLSPVNPKVSVGGDELTTALTDDVESIIEITGTILMGTTAGNLQVLAAQNIANVSDLNAKAGSSLEIWQISDTTT